MGQIYNKSITEGKLKRAKSQKVLKYGIKFDLNLNSTYYCQIILNNNKAMNNVTQPRPHSNQVVESLNAAVLTLTFPTNEGKHMADLYTSPNSCNELVFHGSCPPAGGTYAGTFEIQF